ncbi:MAG TPA: hypothetical protein VK582_17395 [Pyrinomonadaceae bacterium]|nr:hypothetical protein [Pyrinomonadaceae bacterium]
MTSPQDKQLRACPGVAGYQLLYGGPEASPQIIIVTPDHKRHPLLYWDVDAADFIGLEKSGTWKFARRGKEMELRALILEVKLKEDESTRFHGSYTVIAKLTAREVCVVGRVAPNSTSAGKVVAIADTAPYRKCVALSNVGERDWLGVVFGLTRKGLYEDAKSLVTKIGSPATRVVAYIDIARAQSAAGDPGGAHATLLMGLNEVLNEKEETTYRDAFGDEVHESFRRVDGLTSIISAMAASGLYDDVKTSLRLVSVSDLPTILLWVGKAQGSPPRIGGRGDLEAASATFKEAIQLELKRADAAMADSNLVKIVEAQAEAGLIKDARQTVLLIKSPSERQFAEQKIAWWTDKPE